MMQGAFVASRIELKGWEVWRNIRGTGITVDEARDSVSKVKIMTPDADVNKFNWDLTEQDQGNFDVKMMTFLWFNDEVTPHDRKRVQLDLQQTGLDAH